MATTLSISEVEFKQGINQILEVSHKIGDAWQKKAHVSSQSEFLVKTVTAVVKQSHGSTATVGASTLWEEANVEVADEDINLPYQDIQSNKSLTEEENHVKSKDSETKYSLWCRCEYHIVYSPSYGVPVLYFNFYKQDGSLLSLEDIWRTVPEPYVDRLQAEKWTFITHQEHPLLSKPFYQLHPCHTGELMKASETGSSTSPGAYLLRWLSSVGPVVHLEVPMVYAQHMDSSTSAPD